MTLECYDFDTGQVRHFPDGTYRQQVASQAGRMELDIMRVLRRCWLIFKRRKLDEWDADDEKFASWLAEKPPRNDDNLNRVILGIWQQQAA